MVADAATVWVELAPDTTFVAVPVQFVKSPEAGVPRLGVIRDGEVPKTTAPVPV